jgi:hypothetical protein
MVRRLVLKEEGEPINGIIIAKGAMTFPKGRVPVTYNFDHNHQVGWASDFERDDDGNVTAEIELTDEKASALAEDLGYSIGGVVDKQELVDPENPDKRRKVVAGDIREVAMLPPFGGNPGATINQKEAK